ncbi:hypothetical protein BJV82DRAFT_578523 [Fennellomyces sp. T-0311]|nr:hypothetical protein BJV82DRAFT_578523 [Fennellomyces sp. T-0311]
MIHNYDKSMKYYSIFGNVLTYKSTTPSSLPVLTIGAQALEDIFTEAITVNVLTAAQQIISIQVPVEATVEMLKQEIGNTVLEELPADQQCLYHNGSELQNSQTLNHYSIDDNTTLYMLTQLPQDLKIPIFIEWLKSETTFEIHTDLRQPIHAVKAIILAKKGIPIAQQRLVFDGKHLKDDDTLSDYHVQEGDMLVFVPRSPPDHIPRFVDITTTEAGAITLTKTAPSGRMVTSGINVEIECMCTPEYDVISMIGTGFYEFGDEVECPKCGSTDVIQYAVGFVDSTYRIHGVTLDWKYHKSDWKEVTEKDQYQRLEASKQTQWRRLGFEVEPLHGPTVSICTICLEDISEDSKTLSCGHQYHDTWISRLELMCPSC